jgi:DNA-directed RNA polymerase specialized sigma54-like protein
MANRIEEEEQRFSDPNSLDDQVREYLNIKKNIEFMEQRRNDLRDKLISAIDSGGYEDDKGNVILELPSSIDDVVRLEKTRRVSRKLNELVAEDIIARNNLEDVAYKTVRVIDEDALYALLYEGKLAEEELDEMFPANVTWALMTKKK